MINVSFTLSVINQSIDRNTRLNGGKAQHK